MSQETISVQEPTQTMTNQPQFILVTSLFWCDMSKCLLWKRAASLMIPETSPLPFCRFFSASSNRPGRCITTPLPVIQNGISFIQTISVDIIYFDADHKRQIHLVVLLLWRVKVNMGTDQRVVRWVFWWWTDITCTLFFIHSDPMLQC